MFSFLSAANKHSKEAYKAQNNKASSETDKKATQVPVPAAEVPREPVEKQSAREDDKKKSVAQVLTTEATTPAVQKPTETTKTPAGKMPTVVANNAETTKLNTLPDAPVVAETKTTAPAVVAEPVKKVEEAAAAVAKPATSAPVVDCWTPENKDAKKRYNREFLISLKDKKLSKAFPDVLKDFEMAVMEQLVKHLISYAPFK